MMAERKRLSEKSVAVLSLIADGHSYGQIVDGHPEITYLDIFTAAEEALRLNESQSDYQARMARIKTRYPQAYERWTDQEDEELSRIYGQGKAIAKIAERFQRQPSAIRSRLAKLGLGPPGREPKEM